MSRTPSFAIVPVIVLLSIIVLVLAGGAYYLRRNKATNVQTILPEEKLTATMPEESSGESSASAVPIVSDSDSTNSIEEDLDQTEISEDPSLFLEVEASVSGL